METAPEQPLPSEPNTPAPRRLTEIYDRPWLTSLLRPLLIFVLIACIDIVLGAVIARFVTGTAPWFARGLSLLAMFAAAVSIVSISVMAQPSNRLNRSLGYRAAELGLLLALTRIYVWMGGGGFPSLEQMIEAPLDILIDPLFFVSAMIVTISWMVASEFTEGLNRLALTADEIVIAEWRSDRNNDTMRAAGIDRADVMSEFMLRWVTLGLTMILLVAVVRRGMSLNGFFALLRQDLEAAVMIAVTVYFLAGLLLLSHGRLAMLRARWTLERTQSSADVARRWPLYVLVLVGGLALLAAMLPFGGTFLLATILTWTIGGIFAGLLALYRLVMGGFFWLFSLLTGNPTQTPPLPLPTETPPITQVRPLLSPVLPEWVGGTLFWVAIVALVAYAALFYFREKGLHAGWLAWLWAMLQRRWQEMRVLMRSRRPQADEAKALLREAKGDGGFRRRQHFGSADERIRYLYLATLKDAGEVGVARRPSETPLRYAPRLEEHLAAGSGERAGPEQAAGAAEPPAPLPEAAPAADPNAETVRALTEAFLDVRYAGRHASETLAENLQKRWQALEQALRSRRG